MVVVALIVALAAGDAWQKLGGPAFDRFAARTQSICPARQLRFVTPGDLDWYQNDFVDHLSRRERHWLARANAGPRRCAHRDGLACPTTATLEAIAATGQSETFVAFACTDPPPVGAVTAYPARSHNRPSTSPSASRAAAPTP